MWSLTTAPHIWASARRPSNSGTLSWSSLGDLSRKRKLTWAIPGPGSHLTTSANGQNTWSCLQMPWRNTILCSDSCSRLSECKLSFRMFGHTRLDRWSSWTESLSLKCSCSSGNTCHFWLTTSTRTCKLMWSKANSSCFSKRSKHRLTLKLFAPYTTCTSILWLTNAFCVFHAWLLQSSRCCKCVSNFANS